VNRRRWLLLLLAPAPIVATSFALSKWLESEQPLPLAANEVMERNDDHGPAAKFVAAPIRRDEKLSAACEARGAAVSELLGERCQVIVRPPFIVAGDMTEDALRGWHDKTIAPAARAMGHRYFRTRPSQPITVLLFGSKESYDHFAYKLYRDKDISVYGYYKPRERTLVMNIDTGGGTLVHEMTHALVAFDCPQVPDWFNEGLASLHEQCRFRENAQGPFVEGLVNWRLPRLQEEINAGRLPSLEDFVRDGDFRGHREAINYAQARYFCMFMQEQGVLEDFYARLKTNIDADPQGVRAVQSVFPKHSWKELDAEFQQFALKLQRR
jgi:hypothetical protein